MDQQLAVTGQQPVDVSMYTGVPDVLADFVKIRPSKYSLNQYTTRTAGAKPGMYRDNDAGEDFASITIVPLNITKARVLFPPGNDFTGVKPLCRSNDAIVPSPFAQFPQSSTCATCPQSKWVKEGGKNIKPPCTDVIVLLAIEKESLLPIKVNFSRSGIGPFKDFLNRIEKDRLKVQAKDPNHVKPELFNYFFTIRGQEVIESYGKYFVPVFTDVQRVEDASMFGPYYQRYVIEAYKHLEDQDAPEEGEAVSTTVESVINATGPVQNAEFVEA